VKRALEYLGELSAESADDPGLRRALAAAYQKVGDVQGNPYQPNLGDVAGARRSYATAIGLLDPVVASRDASDEDRALLANALLVAGGIELSADGAKRAIPMSERGLELRKALAASDPTPARREELAAAWQYTSYSLSAGGRHEDAIDALRQQESILRELLAANPDAVQLRRAWAMNRYLTANELENKGDDGAAKESYAEAIDVRRALLAEDPTNTGLRRDLAWALMDLGNLFRRLEELAAADAVGREVLAIHESLAAADPENTDARVGVEMAQINLGDLLVRTGKPEEALEHLSAAVEIGESVVAADPTNAWAGRLLASACRNSGIACAELGDPASLEEACDFYLRALDILDHLKATGRLRDPEDPMFEQVRRLLAECETRLAR
jgi:tetratricopeptide (TPR) repeat protein